MTNLSPSKTLFLLVIICAYYGVLGSAHPGGLQNGTTALEGHQNNTGSHPEDTVNGPDLRPKQGWTASSGRGTLDIIWSSVSTMFLCSWSILCLNVPSPKDSWFAIYLRRVWLTCLCFLAPEVTLGAAAGQWACAHASLEDFKKSDRFSGVGWTLKHAFYANMGGYMLHTAKRKNGETYPPFPVDAKTLLFLLENNFVEMPNLDRRVIADKNKVDGMLRVITVAQVFYFIANIIGRMMQGLAIACIEVTTAAFMVCTVGTVFFWIHKPADVTLSEKLESKQTIDEIVLKAIALYGPDLSRLDKPVPSYHLYYRTPLGFVSRNEWCYSRGWSHYINILRHMRINFAPKAFPQDRFENTIFHPVTRKVFAFLIGISIAYVSTFLAAWNYDFPTVLERSLWRAAALAMVATFICCTVVCESVFEIQPTIRRYLDKSRKPRNKEVDGPTSMWKTTRAGQILKRVAAVLRNNSVTKDPELDFPLRAQLPLYVVGFTFCVARTYILLYDVVELRSLPASAFDTVDWMNGLPHLS